MSGESNVNRPDFEEELARQRGRIDALDVQIMTLLKDRSAIVQEVGALKSRAAPGQCPVRPGREAAQLRRVVEAFQGSLFQPAAAAVIWRMIIMSSLSLEGELRISVYATETDRELYWLAREYFGPFSTFIRHPTPKRVLGDLIDGKAQIGVLPHFQAERVTGRWWSDILGGGAQRPKIFAWLPFVHAQRPTPDTLTALAVGMIEPEETGNDLSYLLIEAEDMASMTRLQGAFAQAKLEARWIGVVPAEPGRRHHLVEVKGFITPAHEPYKALCAGLNGVVTATHFLGAAAMPVQLNPEPASHAATA